jgi:hypothetical protein
VRQSHRPQAESMNVDVSELALSGAREQAAA